MGRGRGPSRGLLLGLGMLVAAWLLRDPLVRFAAGLAYPYPYRDTIEREARAAQVDPLLVAAVIREESGFSPSARSRVGAQGLMQLMPETARWVARGLKGSARLPGTPNLEDPAVNIRLGANYLAYLQRQFKGDVPHMLAAYNAGEGNVARWASLEQAFPETRRYVAQGQSSYRVYRWLYGAGHE